MREFELLVIHHSASPLSTTLEDIDKWHKSHNGSRISADRITRIISIWCDQYGDCHTQQIVNRGGIRHN